MPVKPIDFALNLLDRAEELAKLAGDPPQGTSDVRMDVLRSAWVFVGASIDTYFHERIRRNMLQGVSGMSKSARKFSIPLGAVDDMVALFLKNREGSRPRVKLGNIIHQSLLKDTFQGATNVERAFALIGVTSCWKKMSAKLGNPAESIRDRLNAQYFRRNKIAHEGDYTPQSRPQKFLYNTLSRAAVDDEITWTRDFLKAVDEL